MPLAYGIGPLMVVAVTGSASLAGLSVGLFGLSRFLVSYPVGKVTDAYGRKPGIQLGLAIALVGALTVAWSMSLNSIVVLTAGLLVFGMGMAAAHQLRVAVTDMFPPSLRAEALGYRRARLDRGPRAQPDAGGGRRSASHPDSARTRWRCRG